MSDNAEHLLEPAGENARSSGILHPRSLLHEIGPSEELLTLVEAATRLPRIDGKKVSVCALWRWCRKGLRGERLRYIRVGRKICTSRTELLRFFNRLSELDDQAPTDTCSLPATLKRRPITSRQRQRSLAEADAVLRRAGI